MHFSTLDSLQPDLKNNAQRFGKVKIFTKLQKYQENISLFSFCEMMTQRLLHLHRLNTQPFCHGRQIIFNPAELKSLQSPSIPPHLIGVALYQVS